MSPQQKTPEQASTFDTLDTSCSLRGLTVGAVD